MSNRFIVIAALGLAALVVAGVVLATIGKPIQQPIRFNHKLHVEDLGLDCTDCHLYAESGARATIPNIGVCADCHEEAQTESQAEERLVNYVQEGDPIPWRKVYWVPNHVYFSHRRHTSIGEIACETCHGQMRERTLPVQRPAARLTMEACMDCHAEAGAPNDCILCHR